MGHPHHLAHHLPHHHPHLPHHHPHTAHIPHHTTTSNTLHNLHATTSAVSAEFQPPYFPPPYNVSQSPVSGASVGSGGGASVGGGANSQAQQAQLPPQPTTTQQLTDYHHVHQTESPYIQALNHYVLVILYIN